YSLETSYREQGDQCCADFRVDFFFFKQKTEYEMATYWSSDVCSSDLVVRGSVRYRSHWPACCAGRPPNRSVPSAPQWLNFGGYLIRCGGIDDWIDARKRWKAGLPRFSALNRSKISLLIPLRFRRFAPRPSGA